MALDLILLFAQTDIKIDIKQINIKYSLSNMKSLPLLTALTQCDPPLYHVDLSSVETNIVRFSLRVPGLSPARFCELMEEVSEEEVAALNKGVRVLMFPHVGGTVRAVWHLNISEEDTQLAIKKAQFVAQQFELKSAGSL